MFQNMSILNKFCYVDLSIHQEILTWFPQKYCGWRYISCTYISYYHV